MKPRRLAPWLAAFTLLYAGLRYGELRRYLSRGERRAVIVDYQHETGKKEKTVFTFQKRPDEVFNLRAVVVHDGKKPLALTLKSELLPQGVALLRDRSFTWGNLLDEADWRLRPLLQKSTDLTLTLEAAPGSLRALTVRTHDAPVEDFFVLPRLLLGLALLSVALVLLPAQATPFAFTAFAAMSAGSGPPLFARAAAGGWLLPSIAVAMLVCERRKLVSPERFLTVTGMLWAALGAQFVWETAAASPSGYFHDSIDGWTEYARSMSLFTVDHGFFSASFREREPFQILLLHLWGKLFGLDPFSHLNFTLLTLTLYGWLAYRLMGLMLGSAVVLTLLAPALVMQESYTGIIEGLQRDGTFYILMLLVLYGAWTRRGFLLAAAAAAAVLTRGPALLPLTAVAIAAAALRRCPPAHALLFICGLAALQLPLALNTRKRHGSASFGADRQGRQMANMEFPERFGTPGFPTRAEYDLDSYSGPPLTYPDYLFKLHSPAALIRLNLEGLSGMLRHHASGPWSAWGLWATPARLAMLRLLLAAGLACSFSTGGAAVLGALWAWYLLQNAYALPLYRLVALTRSVDHAFPTFLLILGLSLRALAARLAPYIK